MESVQAGMYVTPETFHSHLKYLRKYFDIITLKKLAACEDAFDRPPTKPACVLTFDDGWKDFYDFAFPLLHEYLVPATVFLPTEFIGTNRKFWTDQFAYILRHRRPGANAVAVQPDMSGVIKAIQGLKGRFEDQLETGLAVLKKISTPDSRENCQWVGQNVVRGNSGSGS